MNRVDENLSVRKQLVVGVMMMATSVTLFAYQLKWLASAVYGPVVMTLQQLSRVQDPASLENPWITLDFGHAIETGYGFEQVGNDNRDDDSRFLLIQVEDRWLFTEVPFGFSGNRVVGSLETGGRHWAKKRSLPWKRSFPNFGRD